MWLYTEQLLSFPEYRLDLIKPEERFLFGFIQALLIISCISGNNKVSLSSSDTIPISPTQRSLVFPCLFHFITTTTQDIFLLTIRSLGSCSSQLLSLECTFYLQTYMPISSLAESLPYYQTIYTRNKSLLAYGFS